MNASECFRSGDLRGAISNLSDEIRKHPTDAARRVFLFELLTFAGEWERADRQLETVGKLDIQLDLAFQPYRNLLAAEQQRRRVLHDGVAPEIVGDARLEWGVLFRALACRAAGDRAEARRLVEQVRATAPAVLARRDDSPPAPIQDTDELLSPVLEFMIQRKYLWIPLAAVAELEVVRPATPRDLLWIPTRVALHSKHELRGFMPVLYSGTHEQANDELRLGRLTEWTADGDGPLRGLGQKTYQWGDQDLGVLELGTLRFPAST